MKLPSFFEQAEDAIIARVYEITETTEAELYLERQQPPNANLESAL